MNQVLDSIRAEFVRYKTLAEGALAQLDDADLVKAGPADNSIATICWHVSGNLESRFTDFLTSDGEKPWRHREEEFQRRHVSRSELLDKWSRGWSVLLTTLDHLTDADLQKTISIRRQPMPVHEALARALGHVSYHVGQIVYVAKSVRQDGWKFLSIPPGQSDAYNQQPVGEHAAAHTAIVAARMAAPPAAKNVQSRELEREARALYERLLVAWNRRDAHAMAACFTTDGSIVGFDGSQINARASIEDHLRPIFADHPTAAYVGKVREVRPLGSRVAVLRAVAGMVSPQSHDLNPALNTVHTLLATMEHGQWQAALFQSTPAMWHGRPDESTALTEELRETARRGVVCE